MRICYWTLLTFSFTRLTPIKVSLVLASKLAVTHIHGYFAPNWIANLLYAHISVFASWDCRERASEQISGFVVASSSAALVEFYRHSIRTLNSFCVS